MILQKFEKIINIGIFNIPENMYLKLKSILNNYLRLYYEDVLALLNMKMISENKISQEQVNFFYEEMSLELIKRVEEVNFINLFDGLNDWRSLRGLEINRPELTTNYIHLLEKGILDEN